MTQEPANEEVIKAVTQLFESLPAPVTHGEFNRRMFLEALLVKAGIGVSIDEDDIIEYAGLTKKEFPIIRDEYVSKGVIVAEDTMYGVVMYKLHMTTKEKVETKAKELHDEAQAKAKEADLTEN